MRLPFVSQWAVERALLRKSPFSRVATMCRLLTMSRAAAIQCLLSEMAPSGQPAMLLHYFFRHPETDAICLFQSLLRQVLQLFIDLNLGCPTQTVEYLELCFGAVNRTQDCSEITTLLAGLLLNHLGTLTICVDGIEDCSYDEQQKIWTGLSKLAQRKPFRFMVTGTEDMEPPTDFALPYAQIELDKGLNSSAIETYIEKRLLRLTRPNQLLGDKTLRDWARKELLAKSDGMWVYLGCCLVTEELTSVGSCGCTC